MNYQRKLKLHTNSHPISILERSLPWKHSTLSTIAQCRTWNQFACINISISQLHSTEYVQLSSFVFAWDPMCVCPLISIFVFRGFVIPGSITATRRKAGGSGQAHAHSSVRSMCIRPLIFHRSVGKWNDYRTVPIPPRGSDSLLVLADQRARVSTLTAVRRRRLLEWNMDNRVGHNYQQKIWSYTP